MKIQSKKSVIHNKKRLLMLVCSLLLLGLVIGVYRVRSGNLFESLNDSKNHKVTPSGQNKTKGNNLPEGTIDTGKGKPIENDAITSPPQKQDAENSTTLNATITAANQNGSDFQVRILVQEIISEGTCTLTIEKDGVSIVRTANIQPLAHSSTCKGFDITTTELSPGEWSLEVIVSANNKDIRLEKKVTII